MRAFSCPRFTQCILVDIGKTNKRRKRTNKNTFKERVKFPILECIVEIGRKTKHSRIVVESGFCCRCREKHCVSPPGVCGVVVGSDLYLWYQEKPMKVCLLYSFFLCVCFFLFCQGRSPENIKVVSEILARCAVVRHE